MKSSLFLLPAAAALLLPACATKTPGRAAETADLANKFKAADRNGDGVLSLEEFTDAVASGRFRNYDTNRDGFIDKTEWAAIRGSDAAMQSRFAEYDRDKDGRISLAEFVASPRQRANLREVYAKVDVRRDGKVTFAEAQRYMDQRDQFRP